MSVMTAPSPHNILLELRQADINKPVQFFYENYFEAVVAMIRINGGSEEDAADIFQETVLVLIEKVKTGKFRGDSSIKTFMMAIARNLWLHEKRTRGRRNSREQKYMDTEDTYAKPERRLFFKQNTGTMQKVFDAVGETCTRILVGFYYEDLSIKELLERFQYENEQVLRNRKSKCMKKLKELLTTNSDLLEQFKTLSLYGE